MATQSAFEKLPFYVRYDYHDQVQRVVELDTLDKERWSVSEGGALGISVFADNEADATERAEEWRKEIRAAGTPGGFGMVWIIGDGDLPHGEMR